MSYVTVPACFILLITNCLLIVNNLRKIILVKTARNRSHCIIQLDDGFECTVLTDIVLKYSLAKGVSLSDDLLQQILGDQRIVEVKRRAYSYASYKMRSEVEVSRKLKELDFNEAEIQVAIDFLKEFRLIDDAKYARFFIDNYLKKKNAAKSRIIMELLKRGIDRYLASDSVDQYYPADLKLEIAEAAAQKKLRSIRHKSPEKQRSSLTNYLLSLGYDWNVIKEITSKYLPSNSASMIFIFLLVLISNSIPIFSQVPVDISCKKRLDNTINSFQPAIVPVITFDGNYLFFDRKIHPDNVNGVKDEDDIWFSKRLAGQYWTMPEHAPYPANTGGSDVLFSVSPDCARVLIYSTPKETPAATNTGFWIYKRTAQGFSDSINLKIDDYYNYSKNFYACMSGNFKILLLAIKRQDSQKAKDIYVSFYNDSTKSWSSPLNLGTTINTPYEEETPFLAYDNRTLYFSSSGHPGSGAQDLFVSRRLDDSWTRWSEPQNLGRNVNTSFDENGFCLNAKGDSAYIVSTDTIARRHGIYSTCIEEKFRPLPYMIVTGSLIFPDEIKYVPDVTIKVKFKGKSFSSEEYAEYYSNPMEKTKYSFALPSSENYVATFSAKNFNDTTISFSTKKLGTIQSFQQDVVFSCDSISLKNGTCSDPASVKAIYEVFFDFNSYSISDSTSRELHNFLETYKNLKSLEITGYTDSVGTDDYNMALSKQRAEAIAREILADGKKDIKLTIKYHGRRGATSAIDALNRKVVIQLKCD